MKLIKKFESADCAVVKDEKENYYLEDYLQDTLNKVTINNEDNIDLDKLFDEIEN